MHHALAVLLATCSILGNHIQSLVTHRVPYSAIVPLREQPTCQLGLASSILSAMSRSNVRNHGRSVVREKTHKVNVEVEAEHIGVFIGVTPDSDRELGYRSQLV
jgi:hypothetical protein